MSAATHSGLEMHTTCKHIGGLA